jgi:hypothetical protein
MKQHNQKTKLMCLSVSILAGLSSIQMPSKQILYFHYTANYSKRGESES